jgi:diguanylate cyclase (GGDEF)-like protein/PAS domain S-box-containing protein
VDTTLRWLDLGWMLGAIALASGAWLRDPLEPSPARGSRWADATRARPLITLLPLTVPATIELFAFAVGRTVNPVPLFVATVLLVVLAAVRSTRLVRARNLQTQELERSTHFYAALAQNSSDAVIVIDADGRMLNDAPNLAAMLGRPDLATKGVLAADLLRPADPARAHETLERWRATSGVVEEAELQATHADGSPRWFGVRATNLTADPVVGGVVVNLRDITDRRRTERQLNFNTLHDPITGLANRALFHDRLEHALQRTARTAANVAVIYLDLDDFKLLNDSEGHEAGDELLCEVAARLVSTVRTADTVARVGGDEFAILSIEDPHAEVTIEAIADRVLRALSAPFILEGRSIVLSASIGIALGDGRGNASSMMRDVDVAMYRAKTTGKAKWVRYEPAMRAAALKKLALDNDLRHALARQQFHLVYQPVIDLRTNAIAGFEALLRWDHPTRGVISPDAFIPVAESNGTIVAIGRWVLDEACHTAAAWQRAHPAMALTMAVNLSARQIATPDIVGQVCDALERSGLPPHSLVLEITESVVIDDAETAGDRLRELRHLGVQLAIDDFGTGYSSLSYLRQFDVDILKIDKSFVDTITARSPVPPIVRSLLDLADTLHLQTVAEGIELDVQLDSLRAQACDYGQGFLLSKPLDAGAAAALLAENELVSARVSS